MNESRSAWLADARIGVAVYVVTSLPVFLGVWVGTTSGLVEHKGPVVDFLQQGDIRRVVLDDAGNAIKPETAVDADGPVDVVGHHP